ncbi:hypothetical protein HU200_066891 [Digitaria exilis]|uniref:Uncharacterized protein n=1 Tax=Digitaria exilis TaxID=1010633 RepID=A0A835DWQ9_9POAL|nr:hypothetical protein HU200_066891 [Digitaria exilis]
MVGDVHEVVAPLHVRREQHMNNTGWFSAYRCSTPTHWCAQAPNARKMRQNATCFGYAGTRSR